MVNQAFRIKIAYRSKEEKEEEEKEKIPGIGRYPMGPTKIAQSVLTLEKNILDAVKHADFALIFSINLLISHDGLGGLAKTTKTLGGLGGP